MSKLTIKLIAMLCCISCGIVQFKVLGQGVVYDPSLFIDVNINSGDPAFPYPQFLEYKKGKSLAKYNAEGVTHADMEKAGREAYEIMSHRCRYFGGKNCGVEQIVFNPANGGTMVSTYTYPEVAQSFGTFCSEGHGYMLLAAALFADQKTYNGLYMWIHDNAFSGIKRFKDGKMFRENKQGFTTCPYLAGWGCDETTTSESACHSATDGDVDIALATLVAYKQWGEYMKNDGKLVFDANGDTISYLKEAQHCIGALVDTFPQWDFGSKSLSGYLNGVIGIDGYTKGGSSWGEVTRWRFSAEANARYEGLNGDYNTGPALMGMYGSVYVDYDSPAFYDEFYKFFEGDGAKGVDKKLTEWRVNQFKRATASGNWITKQAYLQGLYASLGTFSVGDDGSDPKFGVYKDGEDFRFAYRHIFDYIWHGETSFDWDPKSHSVIAGSHDYAGKMGVRYAELMKNPPAMGGDASTPACSKLGASPDAGQPMWSGVVQLPMTFNPDGSVMSQYHVNYSIGAGSPAAIVAEDEEFLGDLYRSAEIRWDGTNTDVGPEEEERYLGSTPKYFHGWFRVLGMLTLQGNMHAPADMKRIANMKVYMSVDKTYAYVDDKIDYTVQYRNYGTVDATGVKIETEIDPNYEVISISKGGKFSGGKIVWNIGTVPGFKTGHLDETIDSVSFRVVAKDTLNPRICLTSTISGSNFDDWTSNEYPNHATYTMERNCVDILANRTLTIDKKASRKIMNPGDVVAFTVEFENKSEGENSWLNGGRDNVRLSYGNYMMSKTSNLFYQYYRFWNDASEAYINLGNYRVSYFMYDAAAIGLYGNDNPTGWQFELDNGNDMAKYGWMPTGSETKFTYQKMPNGEDTINGGKWNQRIMIQFPASLMAPSAYVYDHLNNAYQLHKGGYGPCFFRTRLGVKNAIAMYDKVRDDWSYSESLAISALDGQAETYTLISPGWANYDNPGYEITNYARNICNPLSVGNYERILIEEYDGYTWRRIQGTGPLPGREANNVTIIDTIPYELEWIGWKDSTALKDDSGERIKATYTPAANPKSAGYTGIVMWTSPVMLVGEKDKLIYMCKARDLGCPNAEDAFYMNVAWISSQTDSPDSARVDLQTTCAEVPPVIDEQECLFKTANVAKATNGDDVSYKIKFVNNIGSRVDADCTDKSGWKALGGKSIPDINGGLVLSKEGGAFAAPEYSWGKDGEVYATFKDAKSPETIFLVFRYVSGIPGETNFKGIAIKLKININDDYNLAYELYNDGTLIKAEGKDYTDFIQFRNDCVTPTFKFVLRGEKLYMFCNDEEDEWTNDIKSWSGLTSAGPGYFGVYTGRNNGTPTLINFITELDYAFNVTLGDYIPDQLEEITDISPSGEYDESKSTITWPTVDKVAPGDSLVYTFDARVKDCEKFINNYAFATVYGIDSLKALNTIECGQVECDLTDAVATLAVEEICEGDSTYIKAVATPKSKNYTYEFFNGKTSLNDDKPIKIDSFFVKEAGSYSVTVYNEEIPGCKLSTKAVKLTVNPLPEDSLEEGVALCDGEELDLSKAKITGFDLTWYSDDVAAFEVENLSIDGKDVANAYYYTVTDKNKCVSKIHKMEVSKESIPDVPTVTTPKEFAVGAGKEDITKLASSDARVVWYESETSTDSLRTPVTVSIATEDTLVYYVSAISKGGCESERAKIEIFISSSNKPKVHDTTLCIGETVEVTSLVETPEAGQTLIWCDESGAKLSEPTAFKSTTPGETKYYVKTTNGTAESDVATITITTLGVGVAETSAVTYCEDAKAEKLIATTDKTSLSEFVKSDDASKYEWYLGGVKLDGDALIPSTSKVSSTTVNTYKVVPTYTIAKDHVCKGDTVKLDVTVKHIDAPAVNNVITYTLGDTLTDGSFKPLLTQDEAAVTPGKDMTLVWYDEDMKELASEPTPSADKTMTKDVNLTYYVSQKDKDGCESTLSEVNVIISLTPVPKAKVARFCEDFATAESIEDYVEKTDPVYTLKWYDADKSKGGLEIGVPTISTAKTTKQPTDTTTYYVCQVDGGGAESSTVPVKVIVYARPELKTHFDTVCSRAVNLDTMWVVSNDVSNVYSSFTDELGAPLNNPNAIDKTGHYNVMGYFKMPNDTTLKCESNAPQEIYVEIHRIDSLSIVGAVSACPGASVELDAVLKGDTYKSDITYTWNKANNSTKAETGNFVSGALNDPTKFEVTVSDGYCTKKADHTVKIGKGEVEGSIIFTEKDGTTETISAHGDPISFYSCESDYTLYADLKSDDNKFTWSNGETSQTISLSVEGTYVVTFSNKCETSQKITVVNAGIKNNTIAKDTILCEGAKYSMALDYVCNENPTVEWKKDGAAISTSNMISIASASTSNAGKYTYTITNRNCVVEEAYGTLTVSEAPKFTKIAEETTVCDGSTIGIGLSTLTPSTAKIEWESNSTLTATGLEAVVSPTETTTYRFKVSQAGGCEVKDSIIVEVEEPIVFTLSPADTTVCMSSNTVRLSTEVTQGRPHKYAWTNENGDTLSTSPILKAPANLIGENVYTVLLSNGVCEAVTAKSTINVVGYPEIATVEQKGFRNVEVIPSRNNESTNVKFKVDNSEFQESEIFNGLKYGSHTAYIIDEYGCKSDFPFVTEAPGIEYPTSITPNGDGIDDGFISETVAEAYPDARVTIYDRYGKKLAEIKGNESWDGTYQGHRMPTTDYWYEIWIDEIRKKYVGHFTLINQ